MNNNYEIDINRIIEENKIDPSVLKLDDFDVLFKIPDKQTFIAISRSTHLNSKFRMFFVTNLPTFKYDKATYPLLAGVKKNLKSTTITPDVFHYFNQEIKKNEEKVKYYESMCELINEHLPLSMSEVEQ